MWRSAVPAQVFHVYCIVVLGNQGIALVRSVRALPDDDLTQLPDLGAAFNDELLWRHQEARLAAAGLALDSPAGVGERRVDEGRVDEGGVDE